MGEAHSFVIPQRTRPRFHAVRPGPMLTTSVPFMACFVAMSLGDQSVNSRLAGNQPAVDHGPGQGVPGICSTAELGCSRRARLGRGRALAGFITSGRCFGYRNERTPEGVRLGIDAAEVITVVMIFEWSASGMSLKAIAKKLNAEHLPPPRKRKGKNRAT